MENELELKWEKPQLIVLSHSETKENLLGGGSGSGTAGCPDTNNDGFPDC